MKIPDELLETLAEEFLAINHSSSLTFEAFIERRLKDFPKSLACPPFSRCPLLAVFFITRRQIPNIRQLRSFQKMLICRTIRKTPPENAPCMEDFHSCSLNVKKCG